MGEPRTIADWSKIFLGLYSQVDTSRTAEQIWIAVMAHSSTIGECIRRYSFEDLIDSAAHTFCWLCTFVNKCQEGGNVFSLSDSLCGIVSLKYPLVCGHCQEMPCKCNPLDMDAVDNKSAQYETLLAKRATILKSVEHYELQTWQEIFHGLYGGRVHMQTLESIGFHFLEEVGEVAVAVRELSQLREISSQGIPGIDGASIGELSSVSGIVKYYKEWHQDTKNNKSNDPEMLKWRIVDAKMDLIVEIGDMFSWFCGLLNKIKYISDRSKLDLPPLEEKLSLQYFDKDGNVRCPCCELSPCSCVFYSSEVLV